MYTQAHIHTGIESAYVTDRFAIQFKTVRRLIMSEDFWDTLKLATAVLKPALVALRYCDGMKGGTVTLLYNLLLRLPVFKELAWFAYKVSGVMCSASACEHCWSIEGWIHSKRRNKLHQKLVEKLVRAHTNLVLRESLDAALHHLLPWDIELIIDEPVDESEEEPEV
jgi:hypothetical protein